jgi:hypothetical protein
VLTVSPNPATTFININSTVENVQIDIFNAQGSKIISQKLNGNSTKLSVAAFVKGTYTVTAVNNGVAIDSKKIIVQ